MKIQDVIRVYEERDATARAAAIANGKYHEAAREFMAELGALAANVQGVVIAEEMLVYVANASARFNVDAWVVQLDLENWHVVGLRKIAIFDQPRTAAPEVER